MDLFKSKKFWTAVIAGVAAAVAHFTGNPELREAVTLIGMTLIGGYAAQDWGKASK